jgi:hypothetical protein
MRDEIPDAVSSEPPQAYMMLGARLLASQDESIEEWRTEFRRRVEVILLGALHDLVDAPPGALRAEAEDLAGRIMDVV